MSRTCVRLKFIIRKCCKVVDVGWWSCVRLCLRTEVWVGVFEDRGVGGCV